MIVETLSQNVTQLKLKINHVKTLKNQIERKKESLKRLEALYNCNLIDKNEYKRVKSSIEKDILGLQSEIHEELGSIRELLKETVESIRFFKGIEEPKTKKSKEMISKVLEMSSEVKQILPMISETLVNTLPTTQVTLPTTKPALKTDNKKREKSKIKIGKTALEFHKLLKKRSITRKRKVAKPKFERKISKKKIPVKDFIFRSANRFFGNVAENLLTKYPQLYVTIYNLLRVAGIKVLARTYIAVFMMLTTLVIFFFLIITIVLTLAGFKISPSLAILSFIVTVAILFLTVYYYPMYVKKTKEREINAVLPFAIIHMSSLAVSGIGPNEIFKIIAEMDEYGSLSDEFKKIVEYTERLGMGLTDAIREVRNETPSEELKEFLDGLVVSLTSGASLREYLEVSAESAIIHYKTQGQKFVQALKTFSDIYVGLVVTAPLILVSIVIMLASMTKELFGLSIPTVIGIIVYVVTPMLNLAMLLLISKIQPE